MLTLIHKHTLVTLLLGTFLVGLFLVGASLLLLGSLLSLNSLPNSDFRRQSPNKVSLKGQIVDFARTVLPQPLSGPEISHVAFVRGNSCDGNTTTLASMFSEAGTAIFRDDFAKAAGSPDGSVLPDQVSTLLAHHLNREPTTREVDLVVGTFNGQELNFTAWTEWVKADINHKSLSSITGKEYIKTWQGLFATEEKLAPTLFTAMDTGNTGTVSREEWKARFGSAEGFDKYDANNDNEIDQAEFLQAKQMEAIARLVRDALGEGWAHIKISDVNVKDTSGHGGSTCYKVSAPGAIPEAVAMHARSSSAAEDTISEGRTAAAGVLFSEHGIGPKRLATGCDWNIEPW